MTSIGAPSRDRFIDAAASVAGSLCRDALWAGDVCTWIGPQAAADGTIEHRTLDGGLYNGAVGVALFLAEAAALTDDALFRATAVGAARFAVENRARATAPPVAGVFSGDGGFALALMRIGDVLGHAEFSARGLDVARDITTRPLDRMGLDLMAGAAGALVVSFVVARRVRADGFADACERFAAHLLASARVRDDAMSWDTMPGLTDDHATGFAHGASGIAYALLLAYDVTQRREHLDAALAAIRYEDRLYVASAGNWADPRRGARYPDGGVAYTRAWCYGAPGMAIARARAATSHGQRSATLRSSVEATLGAFSDADLSLCHGAFGVADSIRVALTALPELSDRAATAIAAREESALAAHLDNDVPWACGVVRASESPSLMLGMAGIGHYFARRARPEIPSVVAPGASA